MEQTHNADAAISRARCQHKEKGTKEKHSVNAVPVPGEGRMCANLGLRPARGRVEQSTIRTRKVRSQFFAIARQNLHSKWAMRAKNIGRMRD
jgi:hypothetical protein